MQKKIWKLVCIAWYAVSFGAGWFRNMEMQGVKQEVQILICDDEWIFLETMERQIKQFGEQLNYELQTILFQNPQAMLTELLNGTISADILLLDIDMPELNGLEAANRIRAQFPDMTIVFLSNHDEYVFQSFGEEPACFIRKMDNDNRLEWIIRRICERNNYLRESRILLYTDEDDVVVDLSQVCYAECVAEQVHVCFLDGNELWIHTAYHLLAEAMIESGVFMPLNSNGMLNVTHVRSFEENTLHMQNGQEVPASHSQQERIRRRIMRTWR